LYFGTPVAIVSSLNSDGTTNIAPMSSAWALGNCYTLGIQSTAHTAANVQDRPDIVINLPDAGMWQSVERLAPLTGAPHVPPSKQEQFRYSSNKFEEAGLTPGPSDVVRPSRILECPVQIEARVIDLSTWQDGTALTARAEVIRVHAHPNIVHPGTSHINIRTWTPLLYTFRHYIASGEELGKTFRATY
jgi:flavin reductase (DIM6/NTAB) family NADH-FMN oxidoreductase RutF